MKCIQPNSAAPSGYVVAEPASLEGCPAKIARLTQCRQAGIRLPDGVHVDARHLVDQIQADVHVGARLPALLVAAANELATGAAPEPHARVAIRRVLGGPSTCPPILDCALDSLRNEAAHQEIIAWLRWRRGSNDQVRSFLVQRMRPSRDDHGFRGVVSSRLRDGRGGLNGFVIEMTGARCASDKTATYETWLAGHARHGEVLAEWARELERLTRGPCRLTFGVSKDEVYLLSAHSDSTPGWMRSRVLAEHVEAGRMTRHEAVMASDAKDVSVGFSDIGNRHELELLAVGAQGVPRIVTGRAFFGPSGGNGDMTGPTILIRESLAPVDATVISESVGIAANRVGPSSHMVVLARGLGKGVLTGLTGLSVDLSRRRAVIDGRDIDEGDWLTIDEAAGTLHRGRASISETSRSACNEIVRWATTDEIPLMINADFPSEIASAATGVKAGIGLCRSERHLSSSAELEGLQKWIEGGRPRELQVPVISSLSARLEALLRAADGRVVHYRLFDIGDHVDRDTAAPRLRGSRWGIVSGFYEEQIRSTARSVARVAADGYHVDIVVVAPFVSLGEEAKWLSDRLRAAMPTGPAARLRVRLGLMIETPLGVANSYSLAALADVVCVGTNDLTEQLWGVSREDGDDFFGLYSSRGLLQHNPFTHLDMRGLGTLIRSVVDSCQRARPGTPVVVCGEHASVPYNAQFWTEMGRPVFSVQPPAMGPMRIALYQNFHRSDGSRETVHNWTEPTARLGCRKVMNDISSLVRIGEYDQARDAAWSWAVVTAFNFNLKTATNWKFFKRDLAAHWFGTNESRRFSPGWSPGDVAAYAQSLRSLPTSIRFSVFPDTIACHAVSETLPAHLSAAAWEQRLAQLDRMASIEVFPQQSPTRMCFRAVLFDGVIRVEAGLGQAMYVFEQERGRHPVVSADLLPRGVQPGQRSNGGRLNEEFAQFLNERGDTLAATLLSMQSQLGCEWLGIEGYYAPNEQLVVCDLDLPLDLAFHALANLGDTHSELPVRELDRAQAMPRPTIGVTRCSRVDDYVESVKRAGGEPRILEGGDSTDALRGLSGLVLTGGADIDPAQYGATQHPATRNLKPERDAFELPLARMATAQDVPLLAICRGMQVLNVAAGGTLVQDLPSERPSDTRHLVATPAHALAHQVTVVAGSRLAQALDRDGEVGVNSRHHQALSSIGEGLVVSATAPDGVIEAIERPGARFCVGVQWHPENFWQTNEFAGLFEALVRSAEARAQRQDAESDQTHPQGEITEPS